MCIETGILRCNYPLGEAKDMEVVYMVQPSKWYTGQPAPVYVHRVIEQCPLITLTSDIVIFQGKS